MSKKADAIVEELRRMERKRRALIAVALSTAFGAAVGVMLLHGLLTRLAVGATAAVVIGITATASAKVLSPFTMDKATRPRDTGILGAKAERLEDEIRETVETETVAATTEEKRDESER